MGNVKSLNYKQTGREKILKPSVDKDGYLHVGLHKNGVRKWYFVHRLVAETFIQNHNNLPQVNHKDENPSNNFVNNLEYCDAKYNVNYGTRTERVAEAKSKPVLQIKKDNHEIITEFPSMSEVEIQLGFSKSHISKCCRGKLKQAYGYIWRYK